MSDLAAFTLLRPLWLLALPLLVLLWFQLRRSVRVERQDFVQIAPHLREALTIGRTQAGRISASDILLCATAFMVIVAAGPAWRLAPSPFVTETAPVVIALDLSPSMAQGDVAPSRLERARQKIRDLIAARAGGRVGLIAYAGSAHLVMPLTDDPTVLQPFLEGLDPGIMPRAGRKASEALKLAETLLSQEPTPGSVLFVTDGVDPSDIAAFPKKGSGRVALIVAPDGGSAEVDDWTRGASVEVVRSTVDESDVRAVNRVLATNLARAGTGNGQLQDDGWIFAIPAALLVLFWFRRGTTLHWAALAAVLLLPQAGRAGTIADLFWTQDQQGAKAYSAHDYSGAAQLFADPMWHAAALIRNGKYQEAADLLAPIQTAEAQFNRGVALVRGRDYQGGKAAFEAALRIDPSNNATKDNLALTERIIAYLTEAREGSDPEANNEDNAPDATVNDLPAGEGKEITITADSQLSEDAAAQWMRQVQTKPADFLKSRFSIEAASSGGSP